MRMTNTTFSKQNQFIEPKTTFAMFLSEGMKEKLAEVLKLAKTFALKKMQGQTVSSLRQDFFSGELSDLNNSHIFSK